MLCSLEAITWLYRHSKSLSLFIFPPSWPCMAIARPCPLVAGSRVQPSCFAPPNVMVHFLGYLQSAAEESNHLALSKGILPLVPQLCQMLRSGEQHQNSYFSWSFLLLPSWKRCHHVPVAGCKSRVNAELKERAAGAPTRGER